MADPSSKARVPAKVLEAILAVRETGWANMLDLPQVASIADQMGLAEEARWLDDPANRKTYAVGIFCGFEADDTPAD